eukprot:TRINITY_DN10293_c2_g1_i1.p1 TRINITY_DN10293_c2_g1~~TRINITY_DN10293_c2_g1_i1.p1  ORF type:complete len:531 (-),score=91.31 TRINITY_DN10293_c2_g1_i1:91-1683(-)
MAVSQQSLHWGGTLLAILSAAFPGLARAPPASPALPPAVVEPLRRAFLRFDSDGDAEVSWWELAVGLRSSLEAPVPTYVPHPFGENQCRDPTLDALSFTSCLVAKARSQPPEERAMKVDVDAELSRYAASCRDAPQAWLDGVCMGSCSECRAAAAAAAASSVPFDVESTKAGLAANLPERTRPSGDAGQGVGILISSDWHVEPWYLSHPRWLECGGILGKTCRFPGENISNMFQCRDPDGKTLECTLDGFKDPPVELEESHLSTIAAAPAKIHFFVGDTQVHDFEGNWSQAEAITILLGRILDAEVSRFGADNVVWTPGNNDGPHNEIFREQDESTIAWAQALLSRKLVTDELPIVYNTSLSVTEFFRATGFYCKRLSLISPAAYAIVLNTNLGTDVAQLNALNKTLSWIAESHREEGIVYLLGHHPAVMKDGIDFVNTEYRSMIKGVLAGHVHFAADTTEKLFTQVPAITQYAKDVAFWVANVTASRPEIDLRTEELLRYKGRAGEVAHPMAWQRDGVEWPVAEHDIQI